MVIEETLYHVLMSKDIQYQDKSQQLLFHIRGESVIRKSRVVKIIKMSFIFLEK